MRKNDVYLAALIVCATKGGESMEVDVTLMVNGLLVTGFIVSADKWRKHNANAAAIDEAIRKLLGETHSSPETAEPESAPPISHIHLRDAKFYSPGQHPIPGGDEGTHVRISLDAVDGFTFGYIGPPPSHG